MRVINKLTLQSLLKNRTRSIVTIIGVVLSAAMITAVTAFVSSLQDYMVRDAIYNWGEWHTVFENADIEFYEKVKADKKVKEAFYIEKIGIAYVEEELYDDWVFHVAAYSKKAFDNLPINLSSGRLPQNDTEIVIPMQIGHGWADYKLGDEVTIELIGDEVKTYTVVGYFFRGDTFVTTMSDESLVKDAAVYVQLKNAKQVYDFSKSQDAELWQINYNRQYLRTLGVTANDNYTATLYGLAAIVIILIMTASVLMIFNAFAISVSERTKQFGILKSVGATKQQLMKSVMTEAFYIGIIGIPLGVIAGIAGIGIALDVVMDILEDLWGSSSVRMMLTVSWQAVVVALLIGAATIAVSAFFPAIRAARISAIDSIRQTHDIKIKSSQIKTSRITQKLLGVEGVLSTKNFKRNKKRYRATIVSLFVSAVLFIGASAFGMYVKMSGEMMFGNYPYDIMIQTHGENIYDENGDWVESVKVNEPRLIKYFSDFINYNGVTDGSYKFEVFARSSTFDTSLFSDIFLERQGEHNPWIDEEHSKIWVKIIDDVTYNKWAGDLKLPAGVFPAVDGQNYFCGLTERRHSYRVFKSNLPPITATIKYGNLNERVENMIHGESREVTMQIVDSPPWIWETELNGIHMYVPYSKRAEFDFLFPEGASMSGYMAFMANHATAQFEQMADVIAENNSHKEHGYNLWNVAAQEEDNRKMLKVINIFVYGFITLMSLITVANVFNTITTSIGLRRRELAMLKAVGMTSGSLNKMMMFECLFYGVKALVFALPVSVIVTRLIYNSVMIGMDVPFTLPFESIGMVVAGVFAIVFITMMYAIGKVKRENTVEALKSENL